MHDKIDIGLTNFFFPNNWKANNYLALYLGANKYTKHYTPIHNLNYYKGLYINIETN